MATDAPAKARAGSTEEKAIPQEPHRIGTEVLLECGQTVWLHGRLKMKHLRKWTKAEQEGDLLACYGYLAKVIAGWTFAGDPSDPDAFDELDIDEYQDVNKAVSDWLKERKRSKN